MDPFLAPGWKPLHVLDRRECPTSQVIVIHGDEPLPGGQEDYRTVASPAVGVGVLNGVAVPQAVVGGERCCHFRVGVENFFATNDAHVVVESTRRSDRRVNL